MYRPKAIAENAWEKSFKGERNNKFRTSKNRALHFLVIPNLLSWIFDVETYPKLKGIHLTGLRLPRRAFMLKMIVRLGMS